jgi:hypothetical protein
MTSYKLMALSNAKVDREDDFNRWFDQSHIPEVLAVEGFVSVQRLRLASHQRTPAPHPYKYAAIYSIETDDLKACLDGLGRAVQNGTKTDASDSERRALWVFEHFGPEHEAGRKSTD